MKRLFRNMLGDDYRWAALAASVFCAVLAAFSVCVFYHMRNYSGVEAYYTKKTVSMAKDIFSTPQYLWFLLLIPALAGPIYYCWINQAEFSVGGVVCSLFFAFNMIVSLSMEHSNLTAILLPLRAVGIDMLLHIAAYIGFFLLCHTGVHIVYTLLDGKTKRLSVSEKELKHGLPAFLIAFFAILLGWLPVFIACYPCGMHSDTISALSGYFGVSKMDVSFPILVTLLYGSLLSLGTKLRDAAFGGFLCAAVQSVFNALVMAKVACTVRKYTKSNWWYFVTVLYYAVCPIWRQASVTVLKDVLHSGCFLMFCMQFFDCLVEKKAGWKDVVLMGVYMILVSFTRKATFWLSVLCMIVLLVYHWRDYRLKYGLCLVFVMGLFFFCNNVLYPALGFKGEREVENYSLPFQQMAMYVKTHDKEITKDEKQIINETLDYDRLLTDYTPMISDPVKHTFHARGKDHSDFFQLFFSYLKKHPLTFVKSFFMGSFEHSNPWYDGVRDVNIYITKSEDFFDVEFRDRKAQWKMNLDLKKWLDIPVLRLFMGTGFYSWILLAMVGYAASRRSMYGLLGVSPSLILWIGLFMSHVNGLLRYGYPLVAATPLVCAFAAYSVAKSIKDRKDAEETRMAGKRETPALRWLNTFENDKDGDGVSQT